jgi:hypothetical protein
MSAASLLPPLRDPHGTRSRRALALLAVTGALVTLVGGPVGLLGAVALGLAWLTTSTVVVFAVGQVVVAATLPASAGLPVVAAVEAPLIGLLLVAALREPASRVFAGAFAIALGVLGTVTWLAVFWSGSLWVGALALVAVAVPAAYYLHRYARVVVGRHASLPEASTRERSPT